MKAAKKAILRVNNILVSKQPYNVSLYLSLSPLSLCFLSTLTIFRPLIFEQINRRNLFSTTVTEVNYH